MNRFSNPENHRNDTLQTIAGDIFQYSRIFPKSNLAAILDFRHIEFSKLPNDSIVDLLDPENLIYATFANVQWIEES